MYEKKSILRYKNEASLAARMNKLFLRAQSVFMFLVQKGFNIIQDEAVNYVNRTTSEYNLYLFQILKVIFIE